MPGTLLLTHYRCSTCNGTGIDSESARCLDCDGTGIDNYGA
ncbi:hypothetical protein SAMN05421874_101327 [Nonomuraea maritima]|uniref:Uncharacterized protein n=1 Tax=Nonomuraea maritima TaxID=683260 RepID=A0A1G8SK07_9ACTN|nr:hypothetical protein [Nonomuraea maritima]SDJ28950.1 hypothetical protein SAMN05421874_101327 [Nonomuraea maritima]